MSSIDERIVQMKFDNDQFESGVRTTLQSLDNLKKGLDFSGIENGVSALQKRFSTLGIVGMEVTKRLTNAVIDTGKKLVDTTLGQIKSGGMSRALNIEQARFQLQGLFSDAKNADAKVEQVMASALNAVRGTAYGLDEAAKSASVLAASGVGMKDMEPVLTSIAGAAAMTGRSYEDIGNIYSTVASNGKLMTMQLRQFSAAGLNVSAVLAKHFGKTEEQINEMVTKGEISFKDFSDAMLSFGKQAKRANETFSGSLSNMKAALSRIGAMFASPYLTNMRDIFNATTTAIDQVAAALGPFASDVEKDMSVVSKSIVNALTILSGNTEKHTGPIVSLIKGVVKVFQTLQYVLKPIKEAFKDIFPNATVKNLANAMKTFNVFTWTIRNKVKGQFDNLKEGAKGIFTIFKALGNVFNFLISAINAVTKPFGGLINIIGSLIGYFGKAVQRFYSFASGSELLKTAAQNVLDGLGRASQAIHDFFTNSKTLSVVGSIMSKVSAGFSYLGKGIEHLFNAAKDFTLFDKIAAGVSKIKSVLSGLVSGKDFDIKVFDIFSKFESFGDKFKSFVGAIAKLDFSKILNTGLIGLVAGSILQLTKAIDMLIDRLVVGKDKGLRLASTLHAKLIDLSTYMDKNLAVANLKAKAALLLSMAAAMAVFGYTVKSLGKLNTEELIKGISSVAILFKLMSTSLDRMVNSINTKNIKGILKTSASLVLLSVAVRSLSKAVMQLSTLNWGEMIKGLVSVGVILTSLSLFLNKTDFKGFGVTKGLGLMAVASSMSIMAKAVEKLGNLNVKQLAKGLVSITVLLAAISGALRLAGNPKRMISMGAGLVLMASSMLIFYSVVKKMGKMNPESLGKGLLGLTAVLAILSATVKLMPGAKAMAIGASLVVMSVGIIALAGALKILSTISLSEMGVGLLGIAGSLVSLGLLAKLVNPVSLLAASAAVVIFAAGITLLTPSLLAFSKLKLSEIGKSLLMLVGVLAAFGVAALVLTPVIPAMLMLGAAILVLGAGVTVTAAGLMLLATAFTLLATSAAAGAAALVAAITAIVTGVITLVPEIGAAFAEAVLSFIATLGEGAAKVATAATKLGMAFLQGVQRLVPQIISTGLTLLYALLKGIESNIEMFTTLGVGIIAKFILGIARSVGTLVQAGIALMFAFVNALAQGIRDNAEMVVAAAKNMISAVIEAVLSILEGFLGSIPVIGDKIEAGLETAKEKVREALDVEEAEQMSRDYMNGISAGIDDSIEQIKASAQGASDAATQPTVEGFHKLDQETQTGVNKIAENLENGKGTVGEAASGVSEEMLKPMRETLERAGYTGEQIDNMLGQGMSDNLGAVQSGAENMTAVANKEYDKATKSAAKKAKEQSTAYAKALDPKTASNAAKGIAERVAKNLDAGKKTALSAGKTVVKEYSSGISKSSSQAENAAKSMAQKSGQGTDNSSAKFTAMTAGQDLGNGYVKGVLAKEQEAYNAGYKIGAAGARGVKAGEQSNSPSKLAIIAGKYLGEGLVIGINSMNNSAYKAGYGIGNKASTALSDAMTKVYDILNSDFDMNPTITPVLDLSNVHKGVGQMNGLLNTRRLTASVSTNMSGVGTFRTVGGYLGGNSTSNITNNEFNLYAGNSENPEAFMDRAIRQAKIISRMA